MYGWIWDAGKAIVSSALNVPQSRSRLSMKKDIPFESYKAKMGRQTYLVDVREHDSGLWAECLVPGGVLVTHGADLNDILYEIRQMLAFYDDCKNEKNFCRGKDDTHLCKR